MKYSKSFLKNDDIYGVIFSIYNSYNSSSYFILTKINELLNNMFFILLWKLIILSSDIEELHDILYASR